VSRGADPPTIAFSANASEGRGGQGEFLRQMVRALDQPRGVIYARAARPERARAVIVPFERRPWRALHRVVSSIPGLRRRHDLLTLFSDLDFDLGAAARLGKVDLLDGVSGQCCETFRCAGRVGARLVLTCLNTHVDNLVEVLQREGGRHFVHPRMRARMLEEIARADHIRVNSELARRTFVERGTPASRVTVIRPVVDLAHFRPVARRDDVFRVLAVSSIDPRKGIRYLIEGFERARIPGSELVLIGGSTDRASARLLADARARLPRFQVRTVDVTAAPVEESYGACSVFVHAALEDGFGLVIPQALASGRPVIATRQSGASELITPGTDGFVVESRSADAIAEHLRLLASDRDLRERMGAAAPRAVMSLDQATFTREVRALYEAVLGARA
jgi:glycosyltransferase involved in cell wall biosynthesis